MFQCFEYDEYNAFETIFSRLLSFPKLSMKKHHSVPP